MQALQLFTNENNAILTDKLQVLEKLIKIDNKDIQTKTEEFKGEPTSLLHYKIIKEQPKVIKKVQP